MRRILSKKNGLIYFLILVLSLFTAKESYSKYSKTKVCVFKTQSNLTDYQFDVNQDMSTAFLNTVSSQIELYNSDGTFLKSINWSPINGHSYELFFKDNLIFVHADEEDDISCVYNINGDLLKREVSINQNNAADYYNGIIFISYSNEILYNYCNLTGKTCDVLNLPSFKNGYSFVDVPENGINYSLIKKNDSGKCMPRIINNEYYCTGTALVDIIGNIYVWYETDGNPENQNQNGALAIFDSNLNQQDFLMGYGYKIDKTNGFVYSLIQNQGQYELWKWYK